MIEINSVRLKIAPEQSRSEAVGEGLISLVGPNGAGKSTLLRAIARIDENYEGKITFNKEQIPSTVESRAKVVAWSPEKSSHSFAHRVLDVVLMGRFPHHLGNPTQSDKDLSIETLRTLGISHLYMKDIRLISSGELRKVMLARCFVQDTPLMVLDEPCANLDLKASEEIMAILKQKAAHKTIIISLHDLSLAWHFSDYTWMMKNLALKYSGPTKQTLTSLNMREIFEIEMEMSTNLGPVRLFSKK